LGVVAAGVLSGGTDAASGEGVFLKKLNIGNRRCETVK
jgi:hypothetical protein